MANPLLIKHLFEAGNYREFLLKHFTQSKGFASFARSAGFSSRSYPRDVAHGKKRITPSSLPRFVQALGLKGPLKSYFTLLVMLDEPKVNVSRLPRARIVEKLGKLKNRLQPVIDEPLLMSGASTVFARERWPEIYAAMGTLETGATVTEVAARTGIEPHLCETALTEIAAAGLATWDEKNARFIPKSPHLIFARMGGESPYQQYFQKTLEWMAKTARRSFEADDRLFFTSTISARSSDLIQLKTELRELLLRFADHAERADGDRIVRFCAGLAPSS